MLDEMPPTHAVPIFAQEPSSIEKVAEVDEHIGVAMSGLTADARTLIDHARVETQVSAQRRGEEVFGGPVVAAAALGPTAVASAG